MIGRYKKLRKELYRLKEEVLDIKELNETMRERIKNLSKATCEVSRIVKNYIPGKITYDDGGSMYKRETLLYLNGKEYIIEGLLLNNPTFTQNENETVTITDYVEKEISDDKLERTYMEYVVDLDKCAFIRTK